MALDPILHYGEPIRSEAEVTALRRVNTLRRVSAGMMTVTWSFPGSDSKLRIECEYDAFGVPSLVDVCDASGERFPVEDVWFRGKPLEDVLVQYLSETPPEELRRA